MNRDPFCTRCKLHADADEVCVMGVGPSDAEIVVVTKFQGERERIEPILATAGFTMDTILWTAALKCASWEDSGNKEIKACKPYLIAELAKIKPKYVLTFGNDALLAVTGHSGIMKYRGKLFSIKDVPGPVVFATITPGMVLRNPGLGPGLYADLQYFLRMTRGEQPRYALLESQVRVVDTKEKLREMIADVGAADAIAFDIEGTGLYEFAPTAAIVSLAVTTGDGVVWQLPLYHPESVWNSQWQNVLRVVGRALLRPRKRLAQNAKYDCRWLRHFGVDGLTVTFDTIIATSMLDENRPKGLKPLAQQLLGVDPWGIDTTDLLNTPLDEVLTYNGLDTWYTYHLYERLRADLAKKPQQARLFIKISMPLTNELIAVERHGIWVDPERLKTNWAVAEDKLLGVETLVLGQVPEELPEPFVQVMKRTGEVRRKVNLNPSNFLRWWLFDHLGMPVLARGKRREDGEPGAPSVDHSTMKELAETYALAGQLLDRTHWFRMCNAFFKPYSEQLDSNGRLHTTYKPWGTSTGRLTSGKEDAEKLTAKVQTDGVNLQQVPRDPLVRSIFGAPPGYKLIEADFSQIELRLAAFMAREKNMLHLYQTGGDIHRTMAARITGKPESAVTKEERSNAKPCNFLFLYGGGVNMFIATAWRDYGIRFTEEEGIAARAAYFQQWPDLRPWHSKQRRLVNKYGRVQSPLGRVRHLPDIYSPAEEVRHGAERQAINFPVQSFAGDMTSWSLVLCGEQFRKKGMRTRAVGTVHDSNLFEAPEEEAVRAARIIKWVMEHLPLKEEFGVLLDVPIVADVTIGTYWGEILPTS